MDATQIKSLARECADAAADVAAEGQLEVSDPMPGDWHALDEMMESLLDDWTPESAGLDDVESKVEDVFRDTYRARLRDHVQSE